MSKSDPIKTMFDMVAIRSCESAVMPRMPLSFAERTATMEPTAPLKQTAVGRHGQVPHHGGFTLVELLVVIVLLSILSAMTAVMLSGAISSAREVRTQRIVDLIEQVLMTRMAELGNSPTPMQGPNDIIVPRARSAEKTEASARVLLLARRDQFRMAFPDRRADLLHPPANLKQSIQALPQPPANNGFYVNKVRPPASWSRMRSRIGLPNPVDVGQNLAPGVDVVAGSVLPGGSYQVLSTRLVSNGNSTVRQTIIPAPEDEFSEVPDNVPVKPWTLQHESAECLYLILSTIDFNGRSALDVIGSSYVANTDNDAVPEMVDGWGRPLGFIRWPAGSQQEEIRNSGAETFDYLKVDHRAKLATQVSDDQQRVRLAPYQLYPLVVSAGDDGEFGLRGLVDETPDLTTVNFLRRFSFAVTPYTGSMNGSTPNTPPQGYFYPDPYFNFVDNDNDIAKTRDPLIGGGLGFAFPDLESAGDNLTSLGD